MTESQGADVPRPIFPALVLVMGIGLLLAMAVYDDASAQELYDVVIHGGRVVDPETSLDAVRDVGIRGNQIVAISERTLVGARVIEASGLVVAPGFIDLHQHDHTARGYRLKAMDGVTTALELEIGAPDVRKFLDQRRNAALINYGTSASQPWARAAILGQPAVEGAIVPPSGPATNDPTTPEQVQRIQQRLRDELRAGGLGVGMGIQYTPGASRLEIIEMFRVAAERGVPVFVHSRGDRIESVGEIIAAAAVSGAPLHIVHINSSCLREAPECLRMIAGARGRGLDVTTEAYPYIAGMTQINSALFNPGWKEKLGIDYSDLMIPSTGERLTKERFEQLHASQQPQSIIIFNNTQAVVDEVIANPLTMIASDGLAGHPRGAGTFGRVFAQYVRERRTLTLIDAVRKMSYMPAVRLERSTPAARRKGRLQVGTDADLVVFDPENFRDQSTFEKPSVPSIGVRFLLVNGTLVIDGGAIVSAVAPGQALVGPPVP
ncbi:MAG TPA: amidohydrolase family protein [Terriglobales bacterium]|nr:amidohydrolase family protein [Terriglobales bacterium]